METSARRQGKAATISKGLCHGLFVIEGGTPFKSTVHTLFRAASERICSGHRFPVSRQAAACSSESTQLDWIYRSCSLEVSMYLIMDCPGDPAAVCGGAGVGARPAPSEEQRSAVVDVNTYMKPLGTRNFMIWHPLELPVATTSCRLRPSARPQLAWAFG